MDVSLLAHATCIVSCRITGSKQATQIPDDDVSEVTRWNRFRSDLVRCNAVSQWCRQRASADATSICIQYIVRRSNSWAMTQVYLPLSPRSPSSRRRCGRPISVRDQPPTSIQSSIAAYSRAPVLHARSAFRGQICGFFHASVVSLLVIWCIVVPNVHWRNKNAKNCWKIQLVYA